MAPINLCTLHTEYATKTQERTVSAAWLYLARSGNPFHFAFSFTKDLKMQLNNNKKASNIV